jgi:arylsulfatase A-like enzyme
MPIDRKFERGTTRAAARTPDVTRLGLLFVPLILQIAFLRLLETTMLRRGALVPIETLLWTSGPLPFLIVLLGVSVYWAARVRLKHLPAIIPATIATAATALATGLSYKFAPWWITEWVTLATLEVLRADILMILMLIGATLLLLSFGGRRIGRATNIAVHLLVPIIMTISLAGFGYFLATGSPADWPILKYSISNVGTVRELLADSITKQHLALMTLPGLWSAVVWVLSQTRAREQAVATHIRPSAVLTLTPLILILLLTPPVEMTSSVNSGSLHRIVRAAAVDIAGSSGIIDVDTGPSTGRAFDALALRMARTGSTVTPNIVMILLESIRSRSSTPYSSDHETMPFLDSLAQAGALVENMYAVVSYTNKSLVPIYAGIYSRPGRDLVEATPDGIPGNGLPALLEPLGYRSAFFTSATMEFERKDVILQNLGFRDIVGSDDLAHEGFHKKAYFGYEDRAALEPAIRWAKTTSRDGHPFFLNFLTLTSHHPYDVPTGFASRNYDTPDRELNNYYNALRYTDEFLRDFMRRMNELGLDRNTVFIIVGDHGEAFGEHMERTHGNVVWDEALQVPAVLFAPDYIPAGTRISGIRQHLDLLPTISDLLNTELVDGELPGSSLLRPVARNRTLYHHSVDDRKVMALRRDSLKFMYFHKQAPTRVFNYIVDPDERRDLSDQFSPDALSNVELELLLWRSRVARAYPDRGRVRLYPKTIDSTHVADRSIQVRDAERAH